MFGNPKNNEKGIRCEALGNVCLVERGGSPRPICDFITDSEDGINWIKIGDADGSPRTRKTALNSRLALFSFIMRLLCAWAQKSNTVNKDIVKEL